MTCLDERWSEMVVGRSLDALEPGDELALDDHLRGCVDCTAFLGEMQQTGAGLASAVEHVEPPAALLGRIMESLPARTSADPARPVVVSLADGRHELEARRHARRLADPGRRVVRALAATSVAAALVAFGGYAIDVHAQRDQARHTLSAQDSVLRELQNGTAYRVPLTSGGPAGGFVVVNGRSVDLVTDGLDKNDTDSSVYVLWAAGPTGALTPLTGFDVSTHGVAVVHTTLPAAVVSPTSFGVTEEKGRALPTTPGRSVLGVATQT